MEQNFHWILSEFMEPTNDSSMNWLNLKILSLTCLW